MPKLWCKIHGGLLEPYCLQCHNEGKDCYNGQRTKPQTTKEDEGNVE